MKFNPEQCLKCPDREKAGALGEWMLEKICGFEYRPQECQTGPQLSADHQYEIVDPIIGRTGMVTGREEIACGKDGLIAEPIIHSYANRQLYHGQQGSVVLFDDPKAYPANGKDYSGIDVDSYLGLYE